MTTLHKWEWQNTYFNHGIRTSDHANAPTNVINRENDHHNTMHELENLMFDMLDSLIENVMYDLELELENHEYDVNDQNSVV